MRALHEASLTGSARRRAGLYRAPLFALGLAAALGVGSRAGAQDDTGSPDAGTPSTGTPGTAATETGSPETGSARLEPLATGFTPDPLTLTGHTFGTRPLRTLAPSCPGHVGTEPSHIVTVATTIPFLRLFVLAPQDVTLAVRAPDGGWRCSSVRPGLAPREEGSFAPGRYEIWVGSAQPGIDVTYELRVTEFRSVSAATDETSTTAGGSEIGLALDAAEGRFRGRRLRRGFLPDPQQDGARAGGGIDVRLLGASCLGFVDAAPSHVLTLRNDFDYFRVQLGGEGRATLVLRTPGGRYLCSASTDSEPFVDQEAWPAGDYRIWVGSQDADDHPEYRICYTEVRPAEGREACTESDDSGSGESN